MYVVNTDKPTWKCSLRIPGQNPRSIIVILPGMLEKGHYRQSRSLEAFNRRTLDKYYNPIPWSKQTWKNEKHCTASYEGWSYGYYHELEKPEAIFYNVWDFYKYIGYDYKTRKYNG